MNLSTASHCAIKAMDAVCYAEQLQAIERWNITHAQTLAKAHEEYLNKELERQEVERKRRSTSSEIANQVRHQKTNEAKAKVVEEWEKNPTRFPSAEKAGLYLADWLESEGFKYEPRMPPVASPMLARPRKEKGPHRCGPWYDWCCWPESNWRPTDYESVALPTELQQRPERTANYTCWSGTMATRPRFPPGDDPAQASNSFGKGKLTFSATPSSVSTLPAPSARIRSTTPLTRTSGAEAPAVTPTRALAASHAASI